MLNITRTLFLFLLLSVLPLMTATASDAPVLLDYQREISMLEEADNSVNVKLYADGTVEIHYPFFMRLAGDYRFQLSAGETNQILQTLQQLGVDRFDAPAVKQALALEQSAAHEALRLPGQSIRIITDPEITRLSIAATAADLNRSTNDFSFIGVRSNAELYPQVTALTDLATALDMLDALANDTRMQQIEVAQ